MIPIKRKPRQLTQAILTSAFLAFTSHSQAAAVFTFANNGSTLDGDGVGGNQTASDGAIDITLTTIDVVGMDGTLASDGVENNRTSVPSSNRLVVNSGDNGSVGSTESTEFNLGEAWIFSANTTISLDEIVFDDFDSLAEITISSPAFSDIVLSGMATSGVFDLGNAEVPAGVSIRLEMTVSADTGATNLGIDSFTVSAVPEPSGAILALFGSSFLIFSRRRRQDR